MLSRPSLLLNPWAVRSTETGQQQVEAGSAFDPAPAEAPRPESPAAKEGQAGSGDAPLHFVGLPGPFRGRPAERRP